MSPVCSVPDEIVTVAPVRSVSLELTTMPESMATAVPPKLKVFAAPDGVTTGAAMTLTLSAAELLVAELSSAMIASDRVTGLLLVVENVTDRRAA